MQISLVLEEIEMAPRHLPGVVGRTVGRAATQAGKSAAGGEVDMDVEPACHGVELARLRSFAYNILQRNRTSTFSQERYAAALGGLDALLKLRLS
jgi:hypothetical protein